ncbi:hypothetical protein H17ap60334_02528 [Thermosipho africanus H17ap60334]|uniref:lysylphosphatidylglycerol synthase transmembrane domain-containing protein n=1 Tax=Thermosipho africanus TaxID=2421 RepID=UPI00028C9301|nr:lysylphosphatidylglycerol synthase transmembrane domain-containing protein [Thermosipho africanus]EKF49939.1 hypothetical protein H17ap60334_02528 [Thermosipho africanus H17ap60334]
MKKKLILNAIIAVVLSLGIIIAIQFFQGDISGLKNIPAYIVIYTLLGYILMYLIGGLSTKIFLKVLGYKVRYIDCFENYFFGNFFSYITPLYVGGQPFQIYHLSKLGVKSEDGTNFISTRLFETFVINIILDIWIFKYAFKNLNFGNVSKFIILIGFIVQVALTVAILIFMFFPQIFRFLIKPISKLFKLDLTKLENWLSNLKESVFNMWNKNAYIVLIDTVFWFVIVCLHAVPFYLMFKHFAHMDISFLRLVGILSLINTVAYFAPTPGAAGGIEGMYQLSLRGIISSSIISRAILLWRLFSYYIPIFLGLVFIWRIKDWTQR